MKEEVLWPGQWNTPDHLLILTSISLDVCMIMMNDSNPRKKWNYQFNNITGHKWVMNRRERERKRCGKSNKTMFDWRKLCKRGSRKDVWNDWLVNSIDITGSTFFFHFILLFFSRLIHKNLSRGAEFDF